MTDSRLARVLLGILFIGMGALKWFSFEGTVADFNSLGFVFGTFFAALAIGVLVLGGLGLLFNVGAYASSLLLLVYMVIVIATAHNIFVDFEAQIQNFLKALGIIAALIFVAKTQRALYVTQISQSYTQATRPKTRNEEGFVAKPLTDSLVYEQSNTNSDTAKKATAKKSPKSKSTKVMKKSTKKKATQKKSPKKTAKKR